MPPFATLFLKTFAGQARSATAVRASFASAVKALCTCACFPTEFARCRIAGPRPSSRAQPTPEAWYLSLRSYGSPPSGPRRCCCSFRATMAGPVSPSSIFFSPCRPHGWLAGSEATASSRVCFFRCRWLTTAPYLGAPGRDALWDVKRYGGAARYDCARLGGQSPRLAPHSPRRRICNFALASAFVCGQRLVDCSSKMGVGRPLLSRLDRDTQMEVPTPRRGALARRICKEKD